MKRSEVNRTIAVAQEVFAALNLALPPFARWTVEDWADKGPEANEIRYSMLGWDVTDFGQGRFAELGRTLFTLRNGSSRFPSGKNYAEKLILDPENQKPPLHFHRTKMEDIINRGGGNILVRVYKATPEGECSTERFTLQVDGVTREFTPGEILRMEPGQSVCLPPFTIHQFWGEEGTGLPIGNGRYTVSGEISRICDDWNDNCWLEPCERFCRFEEDEPSRQYLVHEYPEAA